MNDTTGRRCGNCGCEMTCRGTFAAWDERDICQLWQCPRCNRSAVTYERDDTEHVA